MQCMVGERYKERFRVLSQQGRSAFIPFTTLGFPDQSRCERHLELLAEHADGLELGIPFSDPIADGPTIQYAADTALKAGSTVEKCLESVAKVRRRHSDLPIGLLVYANLVVRQGADKFYGKVAAAGVDSVLVADVPSEEAEPFERSAACVGVATVLIAPPNCDDSALDRIARLCSGYTYILTRVGVTGTERTAGDPGSRLLQALSDRRAPPPVFGFGISSPQHVKACAAQGAAGIISGSAVVRNLDALERGEQSESQVHEWLDAMREAARFTGL